MLFTLAAALLPLGAEAAALHADRAQHGPHTCADKAKSISEDQTAWVAQQLCSQLHPRAILEKNRKRMKQQYGSIKQLGEDPQRWRDYSLTMQDVANIQAAHVSPSWQLHPDDATSVHAWACSHPEWVLHYQQQISSSQQPFILALQSSWQFDYMLSHPLVLVMDSTFGTNKHRVAPCASLESAACCC